MMMEIVAHTTETQFCFSCLCNSDKLIIQDFNIQHSQFWQIFEVGSIKLCYVCKRLAQHAELFIQNVQSNQILLQNEVGNINAKLKIDEAKFLLKNPINLTQSRMDRIKIPKTTVRKNNRIKKKNVSTKCEEKVDVGGPNNIKIEITEYKEGEKDEEEEIIEKQEIADYGEEQEIIVTPEITEYIEEQVKTVKIEITEYGEEEETTDIGEFSDDDDPATSIKTEKHTLMTNDTDMLLKSMKMYKTKPLTNTVSKMEKTKDGTVVTKEKKLTKPTESIRKSKMPTKKEVKQQNLQYAIKKINITEEQYFEERRQKALDTSYLNCPYKCNTCIKGFNLKASYDTHMLWHSDEKGAYECCYCKVRLKTENKIRYHVQCHLVRYKCTLCGLVRTCRDNMLDHHDTVHKNGQVLKPCPHCGKTFRRQLTLRQHILNKHQSKERQTCTFCQKTYANKKGLKAHVTAVHQKDVGSEIREYPCDQCDATFRSYKTMRSHKLSSHAAQVDKVTTRHYCVECNKAFKSEGILKMHYKKALAHINVADLTLACGQCEKRFSNQKELERHYNGVHLKLKPFKCDQCDKTYNFNRSLRLHTRLAHEGYKMPLKYCCTYCDKKFAAGSTLKEHIRTHTGERPFQCDKCPARFTQCLALGSHKKRIHQHLTRKGHPKQ